MKMAAVEHAHTEGVLASYSIEGFMSGIEGWKDKLIATGCDGASVNMREITAKQFCSREMCPN